MPGKADEFDLSDYTRPTDTVLVSQAEALLPDLKSPYKAAGIADRREVVRLAVVFGKERFRAGQVAYMAFQYTDIGLGECEFTESGHCLRFPFHDAIQPRLLVIKGRNLLRIFDYISLRRQSWIRQAERDVRLPDDEPIITGIDIEDRRVEQATPARVLELHQA
jgi:hypothetical protein